MFLMVEHGLDGRGSFWFWADEAGAKHAFWSSKCEHKRYFAVIEGYDATIAEWLRNRCKFTEPLVQDYLRKIRAYKQAFQEKIDQPQMFN